MSSMAMRLLQEDNLRLIKVIQEFINTQGIEAVAMETVLKARKVLVIK